MRRKWILESTRLLCVLVYLEVKIQHHHITMNWHIFIQPAHYTQAVFLCPINIGITTWALSSTMATSPLTCPMWQHTIHKLSFFNGQYSFHQSSLLLHLKSTFEARKCNLLTGEQLFKTENRSEWFDIHTLAAGKYPTTAHFAYSA